MNPKELIEFLRLVEPLKCNTRHNWTTSGRQESVAEHTWRLAVLAMLMEPEFNDLDMNKVLRMCLIHDWGEAVTGDIPAFVKTGKDEEVEEEAINFLLSKLPKSASDRFAPLFEEMSLCQSKEAKLVKSLDKIETVIQHNEAGTSTWLPLEYDLNLTYGNEICDSFPETKELRDQVREDSKKLMEEEKEKPGSPLDKHL
jgi:putative hydrolase of HD superfamily